MGRRGRHELRGGLAEWFAHYRLELERVARVAEEEKAEALAIGTELTATTQRREWNDLIAAARAVYSARLLYVAHNVDEAEAVPFWTNSTRSR